MGEFFSWGTLATYAGAVVATSLVTQLLKGIPLLRKAPTRLVSYIIALIVLFAAALFTNTLTIQSGLLSFINAAVVSFAGNGAYDAASIGRGKP